MADNTLLNAGSGGDTVRDIDRGGGVKTQVVQVDFGGASGAESLASFANPIPVQPAAAYFVQSTGNSSTAQLAVNATFTGTIDNVLSQPQMSLLVETDQPGTLVVNQYITATDPFPAIVTTYFVTAGSAATGGGFGQSLTLNGNFAQVVFTNTGSAATTKLNINTYYGSLAPTVQQIGALNHYTGQVNAAETGDNSTDYDKPDDNTASGLLSAEVYPRMFDGNYWHRQRGNLQTGLAVYDQPMMEVMQAILTELRVLNVIMHATQNSRDDLDRLRSDEAQPPFSFN
jgi:hypothetical protein